MMAGRAERPRTPALEWIAAAIGLAVILAIVGVIGREAMLGEASQPPSIQITQKRVIALEKGFLLEFEATNRSSATAAGVSVEGTLRSGDNVETATATLDYVAGQASASGGLFFKEDPRRGDVQLRALGYQEP